MRDVCEDGTVELLEVMRLPNVNNVERFVHLLTGRRRRRSVRALIY